MFSCKSCTDDGDDAPSGKAANGIMMNARVAEAISAAKKAEVRPARPPADGRRPRTASAAH